MIQPSTAGRDEGVDKSPCQTVVALDIAIFSFVVADADELGVRHVKVLTPIAIAVRSEEDALGAQQPATAGGNEYVDKGARRFSRGPLIAQHGRGLARSACEAGNVEVAV